MHSTTEYKLDKPVTADEICFTYKGQFNNTAAVWHVTLRLCNPTQNKLVTPPKKQTLKVSADECRPGHFYALLEFSQHNLSKGDIVKTIILLNQYKNLRLGIHQWG